MLHVVKQFQTALLTLVTLLFLSQPCFAKTGNVPWEWSKSELRQIVKLEKKIKKGSDGYWVKKEKTYEVKSNISGRFTAELYLYMEIFGKAFPKVLAVPPAGKMMAKMAIVVHSTKAEYMSKSGAAQWTGGVQITRMGGGWPMLEFHTYPWKKEAGKEVEFCTFNRGVVQHEATHLKLSLFSGRSHVPTFFNEGCATYFETWDLRVTKPSKKERAERLTRGFHFGALARRMAADSGFRPSLRDHLYISSAQWSSGAGDDIPVRYALAESFVDMLLTSKTGRKTFKKMMLAAYKRWPAAKGVKPLLSDKSIAKMEPLWHEHIKKVVEEWKQAGNNAASAMTWQQILKQPITLSATDMPILDAMAKIAEQAKVKIQVDDSIDPKPVTISLALKETSFEKTIVELQKALKAGWKYQGGILILTRKPK